MGFDFFRILEPCPHLMVAPFPPLWCVMSSCHWNSFLLCALKIW